MCHTLHMFSYKTQTQQSLSANAINVLYNFLSAMLKLVDHGELDIGNLCSQMKRIYTLMVLSISRTQEFVEAKILILLNFH